MHIKEFFSNTFKKMLVVSVITAAVITVSSFSYKKIADIEEGHCWQILEDSAQSVNNEIRMRINDNINILRLAADAMVQEKRVNSPDPIKDHIDSFQHMTIFSRIDLLYPDNTILMQSGDKIKAADVSFDEIAEKGEHISARHNDIDSEEQVVTYYVPVVRNGETAAVICGVIDCSELPEIFQPEAYNGKAFTCIVDYSDGSFIMDDWHDSLGNMYDMKKRQTKKGYENVDLIDDVKNARTGAVAYVSEVNRADSYMYYTPVGIFDWELLIVVQEDVAFSSLLEVKKILLIISIIDIIILILYFIFSLINHYNLIKRKTQLDKQLLISNTLISCIKELSSYSDINTAIDNLLKILNNYFKGDRAYLFEINYQNQTTSNSYEYAAEGVTKEIYNLQNVPLEVIQPWINEFERVGMFYISDIEKDVNEETDTYKILYDQNIESLIAVPIFEDDVITGFLGVDNPKINYRDFSLLSSVTFFIKDSLERRKNQEFFRRLSFEDTLTRIYNRNKFNQIVEEYSIEKQEKLGIAYFDLNGLKIINDRFGHKAGDKLIKDTARNIDNVFRGRTFRIGGDEFAVIVNDMDKYEFENAIETVCSSMESHEISISIGTSWRSENSDINAQLTEADKLMYKNKKKHYSHVSNDRRKR
ncbi:MAG: diguanylate cyclase [Porcipelethomonas sp.]